MQDMEQHLKGGDFRSLGNSTELIPLIKGQEEFDELVNYLDHGDKLIVMRAADVIEKITSQKPHFLLKHKKRILELSNTAKEKELMWHLALLIPRLSLKGSELLNAWNTLVNWAKNKLNSRIVRVNSLQALFELCRDHNMRLSELKQILAEIELEAIPSITARIKKLKKNELLKK